LAFYKSAETTCKVVLQIFRKTILQIVFPIKTACVCFSFWRFTKAQIMPAGSIKAIIVHKALPISKYRITIIRDL